MTSPAAEFASYKILGAFGVTMFSSYPALMAVLEPVTFKDVETRLAYCVTSLLSAIIVLLMYSPKDRRELVGRLLAAVLVCFCFVEPVAKRITPYIDRTAVPEIVPINSAYMVSFFFGICAWFFVGFTVWVVRNPARLFGLLEVWRGKKTLQSFFVEDPGSALEMRTNGGSQGQPGIPDTLTPSQKPTQTSASAPAGSNDGSDKSKTTL